MAFARLAGRPVKVTQRLGLIRDEDDKLRQEIGAYGGSSFGVQADVAKLDDLQRLVEQVLRRRVLGLFSQLEQAAAERAQGICLLRLRCHVCHAGRPHGPACSAACGMGSVRGRGAMGSPGFWERW